MSKPRSSPRLFFMLPTPKPSSQQSFIPVTVTHIATRSDSSKLDPRARSGYNKQDHNNLLSQQNEQLTTKDHELTTSCYSLHQGKQLLSSTTIPRFFKLLRTTSSLNLVTSRQARTQQTVTITFRSSHHRISTSSCLSICTSICLLFFYFSFHLFSFRQ